MSFNILPREVRKYFQMSKRQRKHELRLTIWYVPLLYVVAAFFIALITIFIDIKLPLHANSSGFSVDFSTTRLLVSALLGGILTLSAFTMNSLLVVLTTFSGQFSPRMVQDFIADKQTQHMLGLFNGNFIYVLMMFLFMSSFQNDSFLLVPIITVLLASITALGFIFFINHATIWMQVHNITFNMREISENIIINSLKKDLEDYKVSEAGDLKEEYKAEKKEVYIKSSGYIQLVSFPEMIKKAKEDDIVIEIHESIGSFLLSNNLLFSYWGPGAENVDESKYLDLFVIGHKETEIQDANSAMSKLAEVAIKSIGNNDPRSVINAIHQLADLMQTVDEHTTFHPYLADSDNQVRIIIQQDQFESYLYRGFGMIRHYAAGDLPIVTEIIYSLGLLAKSYEPIRHTDIWRFAENTILNTSSTIIYDVDRKLLLNALFQLAETTDNLEAYYRIEKQMTGNTQ